LVLSKKKKILVTGSNGFVGTRLCEFLYLNDYNFVGSIRDKSLATKEHNCIGVQTMDSKTDWSDAVDQCDIVIHLASRAHILNDSVSDPLAAFRETNTQGTLNLAKQAAESGVNQFIFLSSIGVNGSMTSGEPFIHSDCPSPHSPYAISKLEAEKGLMELAGRTDMKVTIIRSPAIYGLNAPGNFGVIEKLIKYGVPLPVASIKNSRSLVSIDNMISFIMRCIDHPKAANEMFFVSDDDDLSTLEAVNLMGKLIGKNARVMRFPPKLLWFFLNILGRRKTAVSLMLDLQINIDRSRLVLEWSPPFSPRS
jgi:nucleoside-diphosphate-sugar epimerase